MPSATALAVVGTAASTHGTTASLGSMPLGVVVAGAWLACFARGGVGGQVVTRALVLMAKGLVGEWRLNRGVGSANCSWSEEAGAEPGQFPAEFILHGLDAG